MSLLIVGSLAVDTIETPFDKRERALGGSATYISLSASYFAHGSEIGLVGVVGEDFPEHAWSLFQGRGFDTSGIEVVKGGKTFFWSGRYHYDMNTRDTLATELNVFADFKPKVPTKSASPDYLVLGNIAPSLQLDVIKQLVAKGSDVHQKDGQGWSALHHAASDGSVDIVRYLLSEKKFDVNERASNGWTPAHAAASRGKVVVLKYLAEQWAPDFYLKDTGNSTSCCSSGCEATCRTHARATVHLQ